MWWHKKPSPKNLEEWLEIATKGIMPLEAEAIAREIRSHYQDELEFQMSYGKVQEEAEKIALADWGNAEKANNKFCQSHVTIDELEDLKDSKGNHLLQMISLIAVLYSLEHGFHWQLLIFYIYFIKTISEILKVYFAEKNQLITAVKYTQWINLFFYPVIIIFSLQALFSFNEKNAFVSLFFTFLLIIAVFNAVSSIRRQNEIIWKFQHYFQKYPKESQMKG